MIRRIMEEVLLEKADGIKFESNLKGRSNTENESMTDMDYQETKIISDAAESEMITLTAWSLVNDHR